ncbi:hypothetical protein B0H10DRAFT_1944366 [Mycena sp. CBHHK59/15]|nr:hypothetical protein B0H10DRAFT_1944366 [Mycena sp. CBHHK59/15]
MQPNRMYSDFTQFGVQKDIQGFVLCVQDLGGSSTCCDVAGRIRKANTYEKKMDPGALAQAEPGVNPVFTSSCTAIRHDRVGQSRQHVRAVEDASWGNTLYASPSVALSQSRMIDGENVNARVRDELAESQVPQVLLDVAILICCEALPRPDQRFAACMVKLHAKIPTSRTVESLTVYGGPATLPEIRDGECGIARFGNLPLSALLSLS